jgi:hypothetical protein
MDRSLCAQLNRHCGDRNQRRLAERLAILRRKSGGHVGDDALGVGVDHAQIIPTSGAAEPSALHSVTNASVCASNAYRSFLAPILR